MGNINWNAMSQQFGESFLYTLENERRRQQEQDQFSQKMEFENRQFDLTKSHYQSIEEEARKRTGIEDQQLNLDIMKSLTPSEEGKPGAMIGSDWEKQIGRDLYTPESEKDFYSLFQEAVPKANWEFQTKVDEETGKNTRYWVNKDNPSQEPVPFGEVYNEPNVTNINMPQPPQAEKWKDFGKFISTVKQGKYMDKQGDMQDIPPGLTEEYRTRAITEAYSKLLPNAYNFYNKYLSDKEKVSNEYFLSRVRWGLEGDELTPEEAQDLIDFSAYRSDLFEINK